MSHFSSDIDQDEVQPGDWLLCVDHPFYPEIWYFPDEQTALEAAKEAHKELEEPDGDNILTTTVSQISKALQGSSHY